MRLGQHPQVTQFKCLFAQSFDSMWLSDLLSGKARLRARASFVPYFYCSWFTEILRQLKFWRADSSARSRERSILRNRVGCDWRSPESWVRGSGLWFPRIPQGQFAGPIVPPQTSDIRGGRFQIARMFSWEPFRRRWMQHAIIAEN